MPKMDPKGSPLEHSSLIVDQFTRQAEAFAAARQLHNEAVLKIMIDAAKTQPEDAVLDVACGMGSVALSFAPFVARVEGLDATDAMLTQARAAAEKRGIKNVTWRSGSAYSLPYANSNFNIVVSRFAIHHLEEPQSAFDEMRRVAASSARIVVCDAIAPDNPGKARAFNEMERRRNPSTVEYRTLGDLLNLYRAHGLKASIRARFQVPYLARGLVARSYPSNDDREGLLDLIEQSVEGDQLGMQAERTPSGIQIAFQWAVFVATVL